MSCVAGHQPNLYPYAGFFAKVASADKFVIADTTQYVKKEYHNRNRIKLLNGSPFLLSVPVKNSGSFKQKINEAEVDNSQPWQRKHEKSLYVNYRKSPFLDLYFDEFKSLLNREWKLLADYNVAIIKLCLGLLDISTPLFLASELTISGSSTSYILDICKKSQCDSYLHGQHAYDYVDFEFLEENGVRNYIQMYKAVEYLQVTIPFVPNLSILDLLFNCGPNSRTIIMAGNHITERV